MNRGILISVLIGILFCTSLASAQDPNDYIIPGREQLFDGTLAGARQSYETFTQLEIRTSKIVWLDWNPVAEFWFIQR